MAETEAITSPHHKVGSYPPSPIQRGSYKFVASFLSRAAFFVAFAALLSLLPSQAPEFVSQALLTRSWELLHLLLVGIAVSYGLFSCRSGDPAAEKEALHRTDTAQSYLTQLLQVSPVFDDEEPEIHSENRFQTWNSRYCRGEPTLVVARQSPGDGGSVGRPLQLPVRSLRSRIPRSVLPTGKKGGDEGQTVAGVGSRSFPRSRAEDEKDAEVGSLHPVAKKEGIADKVVLPSPIPWRSRLGRMEAKNETIAGALPSDGKSGTSSFRSPSFRSPPSQPSSGTSSPRLSPSPSVSPEPKAKTGEDSGKKKKTTLHKPPPPAPSFGPKPPKEASRGFPDESGCSGGGNGGRDDRECSTDVGSPLSRRFNAKPRTHAEVYSVGRSVRTVRPKEVLQEAVPRGGATKPEYSHPFPVASNGQVSPSPASPARRHQTEHMSEKKKKKKKKKKKNGFVDEAVITSESAGEDSDTGNIPTSAAEAEDENEVDKKAGEFIAKFREQIRLQRIESMKRTAGLRGGGVGVGLPK